MGIAYSEVVKSCGRYLRSKQNVYFSDRQKFRVTLELKISIRSGLPVAVCLLGAAGKPCLDLATLLSRNTADFVLHICIVYSRYMQHKNEAMG
jgi:hypothetical protein